MSALHGLVLLYEKQFQIAALRNTEAERTGVGNLSTSVTPTGWIHVSIEPSEIETSFESENSLPPRSATSFVSSGSPSSSLNSASGKNFYTHVWKGMIFLASDPHPSVAQMAQHVIHSVHDKVSNPII